MKKIVLAGVVVAAAFAAAPVFAQGYVGVGVGSSSASGFDFGNVSGGNTNKGMVKIYGGYQITPNWGAEVQYSDLGRRDVVRAGVGLGSYSANQFSIAGTGTLPLTSGFSLIGKLGVSANRASGSTVAVGSGNATSLMFGVGAAYNFTPALSARVEYEDFGTIAKVTVNNNNSVRANGMSVSLKYAF